jgi:hypothetical protein
MLSNINNNIPTEIPFWNGPNIVVRNEPSLAIESVGDVPSPMAKDSGSGNETGRVGNLERVLVAGIVVSIAVGAFSAWM